MKRIIVDYQKLTGEVLDLLVETYPDGYDYTDIFSFKNAKGESVKVVEVKTEDTVYLVKISSQLEQTMEDYSDTDDDVDADDFLDDYSEDIPEEESEED